MVEKTESSARRETDSRRDRLNVRFALSGRLRTALRVAPRIVLLLVVAWAFAGPIDRTPFIVGAAGLAPGVARPDAAVRAGPS